MGGRLRRLRILLLVAVGLGTAALGIVAYATDAFRRQELDTVDLRFSIRGDEAPPDDVAVVAIDDRTIRELELEGEGRPPYARSLHAQVLDELARAGARVVVYDLEFSGRTRAGEDRALVEAVREHRPVVLGTARTVDGRPRLLPELTRGTGAVVGNAGATDDPGNVIRRFPYEVDGIPSIAVAAVETAGERVPRGPFDDDDGAWIDYVGGPRSIPTYSLDRVLFGEVPRRDLEGRIVVVGNEASTLGDIHPTSTTGSGEAMGGPEIVAQEISTILRGFPLRSAPGWLDVLLIVLGALLPPAAGMRWAGPRFLLVPAAALAAFLVAAQLAFDGGRIVAVIYPAGALIVASVGALAVNYFTEIRERRRMRAAFARFVPEPVVEEVIERAEDGRQLPGVRREGTVLFSDLRGFTTVAETMPAERVIEVLRRYLGEMSEAILDHGGTVVSYMGDGIMAVWGAPLEQADHADRALAAAQEMLGPRLERFNAWLRAEGIADGFKMGVGLNSGDVASGTVGSDRRLEYAAVGDTTNSAARLEAMTKGTPHQLFVADSTRAALTGPDPGLVEVGEMPIRGREATMRVWTIPTERAIEHRGDVETPARRGAGETADPAAERSV